MILLSSLTKAVNYGRRGMTEERIISTVRSRQKSHIRKLVTGVFLLVVLLVSLAILMLGGQATGQVTSNVQHETNDEPQNPSVVQPSTEPPASSTISEEMSSQTTELYINGIQEAVPESGEVTRVIQDGRGTTVIDVTVDSSTSGSVSSSSSTSIETYSSNESYRQIEEVRN